MTKEEYKEYQDRFEEFMRLNDLTNLTRMDNESEGHFSAARCECCLTPLAGNRIDASGYSRTGVVYEFSICSDCEYYAEYGQLDDMAMLDIED